MSSERTENGNRIGLVTAGVALELIFLRMHNLYYLKIMRSVLSNWRWPQASFT